MAAIHAKQMASLKREQVGTNILQYDDSKVLNHWRRNRKTTVDLLELPVAVDRQLEDQRIQQDFNRNPRLHIPTKVDKVRSEQIIAKKGSSRDVGLKANVVNKFVREASGIHTYALIPPPRLKGETIPMDADPETNPFVKTYAKETKKKPHMVSFGHRPSSASRTFNPGTMKIRMKHNELARAPVEGKFEFGLSVGILGKLLKAPHIEAPDAHSAVDPDDYGDDYGSLGDTHSEVKSAGSNSNYNQSAHNVNDIHGLFTDPPMSPGSSPGGHRSQSNSAPRAQHAQQQQRSTEGMNKSGAGGSTAAGAKDGKNIDQSFNWDESQTEFGADSWISGSPVEKKKTSLFSGGIGNIDHLNIRIPGFPQGGSVEKIKKKRLPSQLTPIKSKADVKPWDEAHNVIHPMDRQKEIYALKANFMNDQQLNLAERLARYNQKALADEKTSFCSGKQELDMEVLRGKPPSEIQKMASPVKGQPVFFDPLNSQLQVVKNRRKELDEENEVKWKGQDFQQSIAGIPKVAYHPATLLVQLQTGQMNLKQISRMAKVKPDYWKDEDFYGPDDSASQGSASQNGSPVRRSQSQSQAASSPQYDTTGQVLPEASLQLAMLKAKSGDQRALYELFMEKNAQEYHPVLSSTGGMIQEGSLAVSDFNYTEGQGNYQVEYGQVDGQYSDNDAPPALQIQERTMTPITHPEFAASRGSTPIATLPQETGASPAKAASKTNSNTSSNVNSAPNTKPATPKAATPGTPIVATEEPVEKINPSITAAFFEKDGFQELPLNEVGDDERSIDKEENRSPKSPQRQ